MASSDPESHSPQATAQVLRSKLERLHKAILDFSTDGPDGERRIVSNYVGVVSQAWHDADNARATASKLWVEPFYEVASQGGINFPAGSRPSAKPGQGYLVGGQTLVLTDRADTTVTTTLIGLCEVFGSIDSQQPKAGRLIFHPFKSDSMIVPKWHLDAIQMAVRCLERHASPEEHPTLGELSLPHAAAAVAASDEQSPPPPRTRSQSRVLQTMALFDASELVSAGAIAMEMHAAERLSTRTIGPIVRKLIRLQLAERPEGNRSGARLTTAGRRLASKIAD